MAEKKSNRWVMIVVALVIGVPVLIMCIGLFQITDGSPDIRRENQLE